MGALQSDPVFNAEDAEIAEMTGREVDGMTGFVARAASGRFI